MLKQLKKDGLCPITLADWMALCRKGQCLPERFAEDVQTPADLVKLLAKFGALDPLSAVRPGACDIVSVFDKTVEVPPAEDESTPSEAKLIRICAPMHLSLVVNRLRAEPANLTATESGEVIFPRTELSGFSPGFCLPFEPGDGDGLGTFYNVEHIVLCPGAGFDLRARNHSTVSPALFHIHAEMWGTC